MIFAYHPYNLRTFLTKKAGNITLEESKKLMKGILKGVDYLHSNGVGVQSYNRFFIEILNPKIFS
jgi:serine/threonine protein kinase